MLGCSSDSSSDNNPTCTPIACLNGGTSTSDCGCNCPIGFTGSNCSTQITPAKILITKIRVLTFLNLELNNDYWDNLFGKPDITLKLLNGSSPFSSIYSSPDYYEDAVSNGTNYYDFVPASPISITQISNPLIIQLYDFDGIDVPDNMGNLSFLPYNPSLGFPQSIIVEDTYYKLKVQVFLNYVW